MPRAVRPRPERAAEWPGAGSAQANRSRDRPDLVLCSSPYSLRRRCPASGYGTFGHENWVGADLRRCVSNLIESERQAAMSAARAVSRRSFIAVRLRRFTGPPRKPGLAGAIALVTLVGSRYGRPAGGKGVVAHRSDGGAARQ